MHFLQKIIVIFIFDHSLELCVAAKTSNHKKSQILENTTFSEQFNDLNVQQDSPISALILVSLQKALT